jgi:hypothetical protein
MNVFKAMKKEQDVYHIITFSSLMREKNLFPSSAWSFAADDFQSSCC